MPRDPAQPTGISDARILGVELSGPRAPALRLSQRKVRCVRQRVTALYLCHRSNPPDCEPQGSLGGCPSGELRTPIRAGSDTGKPRGRCAIRSRVCGFLLVPVLKHLYAGRILCRVVFPYSGLRQIFSLYRVATPSRQHRAAPAAHERTARLRPDSSPSDTRKSGLNRVTSPRVADSRPHSVVGTHLGQLQLLLEFTALLPTPALQPFHPARPGIVTDPLGIADGVCPQQGTLGLWGWAAVPTYMSLECFVVDAPHA